MLTPIAILLVGCLIAWQARRHLTFSMIALQLFLLVVVVWGAFQLEGRQDELAETQDQIKQERVVRSKVQGEINRYVCTENNKQDRILASLIQVSIGGQSSFGDGLDVSKLTPFEYEVVRAIAKVQELTEASGGDNELKTAFQKAYDQLKKTTACSTVVQAFLAASTTDDLERIRQVLKRASDEALKETKRRSPKKSQQASKP